MKDTNSSVFVREKMKLLIYLSNTHTSIRPQSPCIHHYMQIKQQYVSFSVWTGSDVHSWISGSLSEPHRTFHTRASRATRTHTHILTALCMYNELDPSKSIIPRVRACSPFNLFNNCVGCVEAWQRLAQCSDHLSVPSLPIIHRLLS